MSSFQRSTISASCLSACEIERIHIFVEGSSTGGVARGRNTMLESVAIPMWAQTFCYLALFLVTTFDLFRIHCDRRFAVEGRTELSGK
jgi:hypothetical protein